MTGRSFDSATPIYLQLAEEIRGQILAGVLAEGDRLTSTTEYATTYRINPATANKAITLLVDEGLVSKRRGIGMFVADGARERLASARRTTWADDVLRPALQAGMVLGLSPQDVADAVARQLHDLTKDSGQAPSPTAPAASTDSTTHLSAEEET